MIQTGSIAAVAVAFARALQTFTPMTPVAAQAAAIGCILLLTAVNAFSTRGGASVQNFFTILKTLVVVALVILGITHGDRLPQILSHEGAGPATISSFGVGMIAALWAYDGWNNGSFIAGEIRDPARNVPRSLFVGTGLVVLAYILANAAYLAVLSPAEIKTSEMVASDAASRLLGPRGASFIAAGVLVATFGCVNGMILAGPRVYFAMARDGLFFDALARIHPRTATPLAAIVVQGIWSSLLVLSGRYDQLYTYVMFASWVSYGMAGVAVFIFRRRDLDAPPPRWGYPWVPAVFVAVSVFLVANTLYAQPRESGYGLLLALAGVPFYFWWKGRAESIAIAADGER